MCVGMCEYISAHLFTHTVNAIWTEQVDCLLDQVSPSTVEHPETQVLQEFCFCGCSVQFPCGTEAVICSVE